MLLYHGSNVTVEYPEIRKAKYNKDFYFGFYTTKYPEQAERWATRYGENGYINKYDYTPNENLNYLIFEEMTEEWLDFIVACRQGNPTNMILWRDRWQMIRFTIIYKILLMGKYQERLFGN